MDNRFTTDWLHLTDDETILWKGHPSLYLSAPSIFLGCLLVVGGLGSMAWIPRGSLFWWIGPILGIGGIALLGFTYLRWRSQWYVLTTEEVYKKSGLISTDVVQIRLDRIQNTTFSQSFLDKLLAHGDVTIYTSGSSTIDLTLKDIPQPQTVNRLLTEQLDQVTA